MAHIQLMGNKTRKEHIKYIVFLQILHITRHIKLASSITCINFFHTFIPHVRPLLMTQIVLELAEHDESKVSILFDHQKKYINPCAPSGCIPYQVLAIKLC